MKLNVERSTITVSLSDEGRQEAFSVEATFRVSGGQILPSLVFGPGASAADTKRVLKAVGSTQVVPFNGRPFSLYASAPAAAEPAGSHGGRPKQLRSLKKLGVIASGR